MSREQIWYKDVRVLVKNPTSFWPHRDQTPNEQVNSIIRLLIYITLGAFAYNHKAGTLFAGLALVGIVSLVARGKNVYKLAGLAGGYTKECRQPTRDNPFMNRLVSEYQKPNPKPPCDPDSVDPQIRNTFNEGLPRNLEDIYERENSQRQFYTVINGGAPPDTKAFANFLYGNQKNCKVNPLECTGNE